jgi:hypothetical protein
MIGRKYKEEKKSMLLFVQAVRRRMRFGNEGERIFTFTAACSFFFGCSHFSFYGSDHEQFKHSE